MARKVKCKECAWMLHWALPEKVNEFNYEYAKHCLYIANNSIVCSETMKTKPMEHEQYCKKYEEKKERDLAMDIIYNNDIAKLRRMIEEYEAQIN